MTHKHEKCMMKTKINFHSYSATFWRRGANQFEFYCTLCYYREWRVIKFSVEVIGVEL